MADEKLCDYGCGNPSLYTFKNGKVCCSENFNHCLGYSKKLSNLRKGKVSPHKGKTRNYSLESRKKMGNSTRGKKVWNSGLKRCFNEKTLEKMRISHTGVSYITENGRNRMKQYMINGGSKKASKNIKYLPHSKETIDKIKKSKKGKTFEMLYGKEKAEELKNIKRQWMINGGADYIKSFIKQISKEELKLKELVKELYPNAEPQYPIFRYRVDVALVEQKIAIEFDGWYHFDTEDHKIYHKQRQEKIEKEGWKFLRYNIFQPFPSKEQVEKDLINILNGVK